MAGLFDFLFGSSDQLKKVPTMTPQQNQLLQSLLSQLGIGGPQGNTPGTAGGNYQLAQDFINQLLQGNEEAFNRYEAPYKRQFQEEIIPGLAERFAGMGALGGGLSSSGFGQALGSAGAGLSERLASLRSGLQQQAGQQATNQFNLLSNLGLSAQPFGYERIQGQPGVLGQALGIGLGGLTGGLGLGLGSNFLSGNRTQNSPSQGGIIGGAMPNNQNTAGGFLRNLYSNLFG
jgi:hypothetical protein